MSDQRQNTEQNQDDFVIMTSPLYQQLNDKYQDLIKKLLGIFNQTIDQSKKLKDQNNQPLLELKPKGEEKFLIDHPEQLIENTKDFLKSILEITDKVIKNILQREGGINEAYDKIQLQLEKDILKSMKD